MDLTIINAQPVIKHQQFIIYIRINAINNVPQHIIKINRLTLINVQHVIHLNARNVKIVLQIVFYAHLDYSCLMVKLVVHVLPLACLI